MLNGLMPGPTTASAAAAPAASSRTPLKPGRSRPGIRPRSPAIGIRAIAPATPDVSGPAGTAMRIRTATAAIISACPCSRSGSSIGLTNQAVPSAPRSQGTALSRIRFSPIGNRVARKSATSTATASVTTRRVSPSKLDWARWPARGSSSVATIGPMAHVPDPGSTSSTSDQPLAATVAMVAAWRRSPVLPYATSAPAAKRRKGK